MLGKTNGGGGGFDPSEIQSGTIAVDNILGLDTLGSIVKGNLAGQYVRVIPAPASTTLTDELIEAFKGGVFVNGTFLNMTNPVFFPCNKDSDNIYWGLVIGLSSSGQFVYYKSYEIETSKVISTPKQAFRVDNYSGALSAGTLAITQNLTIKSKSYPDYPTTNTTPKVLQIASNGGNLSWGDVPSPAVVAYEGTSLLPSNGNFKDWTLHRAIKDGNILWVVISGYIEKDAGTPTLNVSDLFSFTLPSEISSKIYREDGTTCDNANAGGVRVLAACGTLNNGAVRYVIDSLTANNFTVSFSSIAQIDSSRVDCRIPIFLNIGD